MPSLKLLLQVLPPLCMILGLIIIFIALATPAWQVAYVRELQQWHQSGLWMSCHTRPSGMHMCSYAFSDDELLFHVSDDIVNIRTPAFHPWQRSLLHIFLVGQLCALLSLISCFFSHSSIMEKVTHILFLGFACLAALICTGCTIAFAIFSYMVEYRFHHVSVSGVYEKHRGYSFHIALAGSLLYVISLLLAIPYTVQVIRENSLSRGGNAPDRMMSNYPAFNMPHHFQEEQFAMRELPHLPRKGRWTQYSRYIVKISAPHRHNLIPSGPKTTMN